VEFIGRSQESFSSVFHKLQRESPSSFSNSFLPISDGISSLGVHITFVRSIAMDSWAEKQLAMMKTGGNKKLNDYLKSRGIDAGTPIKAKYESEAAQLYKEILKARVEGRPEPTSLPTKSASAPSSMNRPMSAAGGGRDPNGMERLPGESEQQYITRQTKLRDQARARMASKFGNSGMRGVGSGGMQGIGSDPNYNPNGGYGVDLDNVMSGVTSAFSSGISLMGSVASTAANTVGSVVQEDSSARTGLSQVKGTVSSYGGSFWSNLNSGISTVADSITATEEEDGLSDLQRQFSANKPSQSKYSGFGSESTNPNNGFSQFSSKPRMGAMKPSGTTSSAFAGAPGHPGEDPNGIERLSGESDEQYVARQTRLRDEARARMTAKFGGGDLSSASSSSQPNFTPAPSKESGTNSTMAPMPPAGTPSSGFAEALGLPGEDRNGIERLTGESDEQYVARQTRLRDEARARMAAKFGGGGLSSTSSSSQSKFGTGRTPSFNGNLGSTAKALVSTPARSSVTALPRSAGLTLPRKSSTDTLKSDDFFASFGA
jgi:ADP-ribosylation factor GTPase-activating protein 1